MRSLLSADTCTHVCDRHVAHAGEHAHRPGPPLVVSRSPPQPRPRATADASQPRIRFLSAKVSYTRHHAGDTLARAASLATSVETSVPVLGTGARALQLRLAFQRGDAAHCSALPPGRTRLCCSHRCGARAAAQRVCVANASCVPWVNVGGDGEAAVNGPGLLMGQAQGPEKPRGDPQRGRCCRPVCQPHPHRDRPATCLAIRGRQTRSRDV